MAVFVGVAVVPIAVVIHPVVPGVGRPVVGRVIGVVAVRATVRVAVLPVAVRVEVTVPGTVGIDAVVPGNGGAGVGRGAGLVSVGTAVCVGLDAVPSAGVGGV